MNSRTVSRAQQAAVSGSLSLQGLAPGQYTLEIDARYFDVDGRIASMDAWGIERQLLSLPGLFGVDSLRELADDVDLSELTEEQRKRVRHVIAENARVRATVELLEDNERSTGGDHDARIRAIGDLLVVHASPRSIYDKAGGPHNTAAEATAAYAGTGAAAIAFGHYHVSFVRPMPFALLLNVASVGIPVDRQPLAAYTVLTATADGWIVEQRRVPYDVDEERRVADATGMPRWEPDPT